MSGIFITFEGGDGSGKTTQCDIFVNRLRADGGRRVVFIREPGGTRLGERLREIIKYGDACPKSELFMLAASRAELVNQVIAPALQSGLVVVSDRFCDSTIAYQGYGRGLDLGEVRRITEISSGGLTPDLTFLVDVRPEIAKKRILERGEGSDNFDRQEEEFAKKVRNGYFELASENHQRFCIVDGQGDPSDVSERIHRQWLQSKFNRISRNLPRPLLAPGDLLEEDPRVKRVL